MAAEAEFGDPYVVLQPVRSGNAYEETIEHLLRAIKIGVFPVGEKLPPERELAEHLGVSRATLRDALADMQRVGVIDVQRGRYGGTYVRSAGGTASGQPHAVPARQRIDALRFRAVVEPAAAAMAAEAELPVAARDYLRSCLDDACSATEDTYRPLDSRFHIAIAELAGSASLVAAVADNRATINALLDEIPVMATNVEHSHQQHREITMAIERGESDRARELMVSHIRGTEFLLRGFLD